MKKVVSIDGEQFTDENDDGIDDNDPTLKIDTAGEEIGYEIVVTNTGNVDILGAEVNDPLFDDTNPLSVDSGDDADAGTLNVGEVWTYGETYTVTQADLNSDGTLEPDDQGAGFIDNTATLSSTDLGDQSDDAKAPLAATASLMGTYFCDKDDNGLLDRDPGPDTGVAGKTVTLIDLGDDGLIGGTGDDADTVVGDTLTDENGNYAFNDLEAGFYAVEFEGSGNEFVFKDANENGPDQFDSDVGRVPEQSEPVLTTDPIELQGVDVTGINAGIECFKVNNDGPGLTGAASQIVPALVVLSGNGTTTYDAGDDVLSVQTPAAFAFDDALNPLDLGQNAVLKVDIAVDDGGNFAGSFGDQDLILFNDDNMDGVFDEGEDVLLTAEALGFGFENGVNTDLYDGFFEVTGGELSEEFSEFVAISWSSEFSTFDGTFDDDFEGLAKATLGSTDLDCIC